MKKNTGLIKITDIDGLNYMIQSNIKYLDYKGTAETYSIKYVSKGTEVYHVDQKEKIVNSKNFLLTNSKIITILEPICVISYT